MKYTITLSAVLRVYSTNKQTCGSIQHNDAYCTTNKQKKKANRRVKCSRHGMSGVLYFVKSYVFIFFTYVYSFCVDCMAWSVLGQVMWRKYFVNNNLCDCLRTEDSAEPMRKWDGVLCPQACLIYLFMKLCPAVCPSWTTNQEGSQQGYQARLRPDQHFLS